MTRCSFARFASSFAALLLCGVLAACGGGLGPAPVVKPQAPYAGNAPPATAPHPPAAPASDAIKVAVLLPLSGANADLGKAMLNAAQLALFAVGGDKLTLVPRDTTGTAQGAADAAKAAIGEGAKLIIGPLVSDEVDAVKPIARDAHVNVIAFATKTQVAGDNVFLMGFLPKQEVAREVTFANSKGLKRFAVLAPSTAYGHLMADALKEIAASSGSTVVRAEFFTGDPGPVIKKMAPANGAAPGFDALLLPVGGDQLKQISQQLKAAGIDSSQTRLLGSGLWDDPGIESESALTGGWFAASPPDARADFASRYQGAYGNQPPRLASLAFDAAALAAVLAKSSDPDPFSQAAIENPNGFTGVDGLFRFNAQGLVQRGLAVLEVRPNGDTIVSPAPHNFQDLAF